jgi:hypothetical protein
MSASGNSQGFGESSPEMNNQLKTLTARGGIANPMIALVAVGLLFATGAGCASSNASPEVQVARQEQLFTLGLEAVNTGLESGQLDKAEFAKLRPLVIAANAYLDAAKASAVEVETLEAKLAASVNTEERADLQRQLDVARDQFTRSLKSLNAALKAFDTARQEAHAAPVRDTVKPPATAAARPTALRDRQPPGVRGAWRGDGSSHRVAVAGA